MTTVSLGAVHGGFISHCAVLYFITLYFTCTALHSIALHYTALHCTALHCIALHHTALHCTALHQTLKKCKHRDGRTRKLSDSGEIISLNPKTQEGGNSSIQQFSIHLLIDWVIDLNCRHHYGKDALCGSLQHLNMASHPLHMVTAGSAINMFMCNTATLYGIAPIVFLKISPC